MRAMLVVTALLNIIFSVVGFMLFVSYYTPGNPARPLVLYLDNTLIASVINLFFQLPVLVVVIFCTKIGERKLLLKFLLLFNLVLCSTFMVFVPIGLKRYCGYVGWC